jgi:hypothetical protein
MFARVRYARSFSCLFALLASCQGVPGEDDMRNELPPISDWPHARGGVDSVVSPATAGNAPPPTPPANLGAGGATGGATTATPPLSGSPITLDAGSVASPTTGASDSASQGAADAGVPAAADAGMPADGAVDAGPALGESDAGCVVPFVPDASLCLGFGCRRAFDPLLGTAPPGVSSCR